MSAGWGRFQDEGAGPDWLAAPGEDDGPPDWAAEPGAAGAGPSKSADGAPDGAAEPGPGAGSSGSADGAPGWAAVAEPGAAGTGPSGWATLADAAGGRGAASASGQSERSDRSDRSGQWERGGAARAGQQRGAGTGSSRGFGEDRRGGSSAAKKTAAKKTAAKKTAAKKTVAKSNSSGWSSRRKDRDPADAGKPKPPPSREKLEQQAKNILMYHLGRQMQTRSQLKAKLRKKDIPDDIAEAALDRFEELRLLDDATYAEAFVRSRHTERGLAKRALGYELRKRGVDDETAAEALSAVDEDQEAVTARRLVDSRLRATKGLDPQVRTRRLVGMLARKGYSSSVSFRAVKEALAEEGQDVEFDDPGFD